MARGATKQHTGLPAVARAAVLATALVASAAALAQAGIATNPRSLYVLHCAGCHGFDGSGVADKGVPSMRDTLGHFLRLPEGRAFLVQVPGVNNAGLSDEQIAQVTNWTIKTFSAQAAPAGWAPYTAGEVTDAKRHRPTDVAKLRAELIRRLRGEGVAIE